MQAYSMDLRERVFADFESGMKPSAIGEKYRVTARFVQKLVKRQRETGSIAPRKGQTGPKAKWLEHLEGIQQLVESHPDATLEEYARLFEQELGLKISYSSVWRVFKKLNITFKKSTACC